MTAQTTRPVALIVGGTSGIGLATARALHAHGFDLVVTGRNPHTLADARSALPAEVVALEADVASLADAERVATELERRFGRVDLALFNAAVVRMAPLEAVDESSFDELLAVNLKGHVFLLQRILPLLGPGSSVVFTSSTLSERGFSGASIYSATKGAQLSLMRALAVELAPRGIRVNAVSPGPTETPALGKLGLPPEQLEGMKQSLTARIPLGRFGAAEEVANTVAFLASPAAAFITGATIAVDGGFGAG
jgi:NAD(P)-dependent dehydrogenase (short-subunit alcohol dehydrogenase family)